jgi:hypothetical protein
MPSPAIATICQCSRSCCLCGGSTPASLGPPVVADEGGPLKQCAHGKSSIEPTIEIGLVVATGLSCILTEFQLSASNSTFNRLILPFSCPPQDRVFRDVEICCCALK